MEVPGEGLGNHSTRVVGIGGESLHGRYARLVVKCAERPPAARRDPYFVKAFVWTSRLDCWNWAGCSSAVGMTLEYGNRKNSSLDVLSSFWRGYHQSMFRRIQFSSFRPT